MKLWPDTNVLYCRHLASYEYVGPLHTRHIQLWPLSYRNEAQDCCGESVWPQSSGSVFVSTCARNTINNNIFFFVTILIISFVWQLFG
jgi:hypothetical protein